MRISSLFYILILIPLMPWSVVAQIQELKYDSITHTYKILEHGQATLAKQLGGDKFVAMHREIEVGAFIRVYNPENQRFVMVRTVGVLPENIAETKDITIQLSPKAFQQIQTGGQEKIEVELTYTSPVSKELGGVYQNLQKKTLEIAKLKSQKRALKESEEELKQMLKASKKQLYNRTIVFAVIAGLLCCVIIFQWLSKRKA